MAKAKQGLGQGWSPDPHPKRKGIHAKRGTSAAPSSKNYKKKYRGQGRV